MLAWVFDLLLRHPDALGRVQIEAMNGEEDFTTAVINETLRIRPPAPFTARVAAQPFPIGGYHIAAGTRIVVHTIAINRDPQSYAHPNEFRPERFLGSRPQTYAWVPFGGGVRSGQIDFSGESGAGSLVDRKLGGQNIMRTAAGSCGSVVFDVRPRTASPALARPAGAGTAAELL